MAVPLWRQIQKQNFKDSRELLPFLGLCPQGPLALHKSAFPLNLPRRLAEKIVKGRWDDPVLRQFVPTTQEEIASPEFSLDPVEDTAFLKAPKLLHKYQGRALLLSTSACAMNCRYCFRRHFDYETEVKGFAAELEEIRDNAELSEILLSGGDPLSLDDVVLGNLLKSLDAIPHIERVRFHTRFPIGIPERIDDGFLKALDQFSRQIIFVIHVNHAQELDAEIFTHLKLLQTRRIPILSQSVLLKGVNDSVEALEELCFALINHGILPYYLHQLDRVQGAHHFEVEERKGHQLLAELNKRVPGYAVPRYVKEEAHAPHKTPLIPIATGITSCPKP